MTDQAIPAAHSAVQDVPLSEAFRRYVQGVTTRDVTLAEVVMALGERSLLVGLIIFSLPNCIPAPPAVGSIFALPVLIVAWQMLRGYEGLRLPQILARRRVAVKHLRWIAEKGLRPLRAVERRCRPRVQVLVSARAERRLAAYILVLAAVVLFPGPMTNFLPAIGIVIISVGLLERDGLVVVYGAVWGFVAMIIAIAATIALFGGLWLGLDALFG